MCKCIFYRVSITFKALKTKNQQTTMKKILLILAICFLSFTEAMAQVEYKVITSVESIVPNGLGRSRIISASE